MKNIIPRNKKGNAHGYWEVYNPNGSINHKGFYDNGKLVGYSESYWNNELNRKKYHI